MEIVVLPVCRHVSGEENSSALCAIFILSWTNPPEGLLLHFITSLQAGKMDLQAVLGWFLLIFGLSQAAKEDFIGVSYNKTTGTFDFATKKDKNVQYSAYAYFKNDINTTL